VLQHLTEKCTSPTWVFVGVVCLDFLDNPQRSLGDVHGSNLSASEAGELFCESAKGGHISTDFPNTTPWMDIF
jgi:hypothetical protein